MGEGARRRTRPEDADVQPSLSWIGSSASARLDPGLRIQSLVIAREAGSAVKKRGNRDTARPSIILSVGRAKRSARLAPEFCGNLTRPQAILFRNLQAKTCARVASSPHESRRDGFICTGRARLDQLLPRRHKTTPKRFFLDCLPGNRPVFLHQLAPPTRIDPHDEMDAAKDQTSRVIWPVTLTTFS